jgi:hypothetical protein
MKKLVLGALAGVLVLAATHASAGILKLRTHAGNSTGNVETFLPIDGAATAVSFSAEGDYVAVTFSAECSTNSPAPVVGWVDIDILVDGVEAAPSAGDFDAFCTEQTNSWVTASRTVRAAINPALASHSVRVRVKRAFGGAATSWWIGDSTIMVQQ